MVDKGEMIEMMESYCFELRHNQRNKAERMIRSLGECGFPVEVQYREREGSIFLRISFDPEEYQEERKRGAGRKKMKVGKKYTCREVLDLIEEHGMQKAAEVLGISRSTLYRRMAGIKYKSMDDLFE